MGWDGVKLDRGETPKDYIIKDVRAAGNEVVAIEQFGEAFYLAIGMAKDAAYHPGKTVGCVVLVNKRGGWTYFKWMSEDEGPFYHDAPRYLVESLTAEPTGYAARWRERCLSHA